MIETIERWLVHEPLVIIEEMLATNPKCGSTHIIAIDGRAGSGKTVFAQNLSLFLSHDRKVEILHLDDVYSGWEDALGQPLTATLSHLLSSIAHEEQPTIKIFNWSAGIFDSERTIPTSDVLIIEGVGSAQSLVRKFASLSIWLEIEAKIGLSRVLQRDGRQIEKQMSLWQINEEKHFAHEQSKENADFILSTIG